MGLKYRPERVWKWRGWTATFGIDNVPVPEVRWYWWDQDIGLFDFTVNNGGDPIVSLSTPNFAPPRWLMPLVNLLDR